MSIETRPSVQNGAWMVLLVLAVEGRILRQLVAIDAYAYTCFGTAEGEALLEQPTDQGVSDGNQQEGARGYE